MIRLSLLLAATLPLVADDQARPDLLRLTNGELEGHFGGLDAKGVLRWEREDGIAPMEFKTDKVRQIVLHGGHPVDAGKDAAHLELVNGDRLPAHVVSLENDTFTVDTPMAGRLMIPRDAVVQVAPNPFGGRLIYAGPFSEDGWEVYSPDDDFPDFAEEKKDDAEEEEEQAPAEDREPSWKHRGSKWYFSSGRDALRSAIGMPDQAILRFELEWRNRPPIAIAFHADFKDPVYPPAREDEKLSEKEQKELQEQRDTRRRTSQHLADYFGNAYVLTLRSSYAQLQQCGFNKEGEPFINQIRSSSTNIRFDDTGVAVFELRCDRSKGSVSLFVNGEFSMQWDLKPGIEVIDDDEEMTDAYGGLGDGIGFQMLGSDTPVRISDIIVAEWNGMPDSARSLKSEEFDVVLLNNGTDRFSGKVGSIKDGSLTLESRYAPLDIPLDEIAEIHLAENGQRKFEDSADKKTRVHFQPIGRISGVAGVTSDKRMDLSSPLLQKMSLDLTSAVILEFQSGSSFLNYWDEEL